MAPRRSGNGKCSGPGGLKHPGMAPAQGGPHPSTKSSNSITNSKQRLNKASKDDFTYIKEQRSMNRWPCVNVYQVYLVVQLGLGRCSCIKRQPSVRLVVQFGLVRIIGHVYFHGHTCGEVISAQQHFFPYVGQVYLNWLPFCLNKCVNKKLVLSVKSFKEKYFMGKRS